LVSALLVLTVTLLLALPGPLLSALLASTLVAGQILRRLATLLAALLPTALLAATLLLLMALPILALALTFALGSPRLAALTGWLASRWLAALLATLLLLILGFAALLMGLGLLGLLAWGRRTFLALGANLLLRKLQQVTGISSENGGRNRQGKGASDQQ
jgi:hypothetical protein